ncbi:MAG: isoprenylcysteine carboxylmethyltransferase family protein [Candidatus Hodarchaeales archaeon]|jgi:protein-S-isoprenylcysteine O-methyltransferase Ste14
MDESTLFRLLLMILYGIFATVRIYYRTRSRAPKKDNVEQKEGIDKIGGLMGIIMSVGIIGMFIAIIIYLIAPSWFLWSQFPLPASLRIIGVITGLFSIPLLIWTHKTLGKYYAPVLELKEEHTLINEGPYTFVRHPMYSVFILFTLSMALITSNLFVMIFTLIVVIPFPFIARKEEKMLLNELGSEYQYYMERTGRFFPIIRRLKVKKQ